MSDAVLADADRYPENLTEEKLAKMLETIHNVALLLVIEDKFGKEGTIRRIRKDPDKYLQKDDSRRHLLQQSTHINAELPSFGPRNSRVEENEKIIREERMRIWQQLHAAFTDEDCLKAAPYPDLREHHQRLQEIARAVEATSWSYLNKSAPGIIRAYTDNPTEYQTLLQGLETVLTPFKTTTLQKAHDLYTGKFRQKLFTQTSKRGKRARKEA